MDGEIVFETIREAMQAAVLETTGVGSDDFNFSMKPNKSLLEGGLGIESPNWRMVLRTLQEKLPNEAPYRNKDIVDVAADTFAKTLSETCTAIFHFLVDD